MRLLNKNTTDTALSFLRQHLVAGGELDAIVPAASVFALDAIEEASSLKRVRFLLPPSDAELCLLGDEADRGERSRLHGRSAAATLTSWLRKVAEVRRTTASIPQGLLVLRDPSRTNPAYCGVGPQLLAALTSRRTYPRYSRGPAPRGQS